MPIQANRYSTAFLAAASASLPPALPAPTPDPRPAMRLVHSDAVTAIVVERFLKKTRRNMTSGCLGWTGAGSKEDRPTFWCDGKMERATRTAYRLFCGPVAPGETIRHTCGRPDCVNPLHLWKDPYRTDITGNGSGGPKGRVAPSPLLEVPALEKLPSSDLYEAVVVLQREVAALQALYVAPGTVNG